MLKSGLGTLPPQMQGLVEAVPRGLLDETLRQRWMRLLQQGRVTWAGVSDWLEHEVWVGGMPVWVCLTTDSVMEAPTGKIIIGSRENVDRMLGPRPRRPRMEVWQARVRFKDVSATRAEVAARMQALGGAAPWQMPAHPTNRADEVWVEVWVPVERRDAILKDLQEWRVRGVRRVEAPSSWMS